MKYAVLFVVSLFVHVAIPAQGVSDRLQKAFTAFEKDEQLKHAISSLYVIDAKTGQVVFDRNAQVGLAPASTQKIITSVTAFELLGKDYRYKTELGLTHLVRGNNVTADDFVILGSGDPTLGSSRYGNTKPELLLSNWKKALQAMGITNIADLHVFADDSKWGTHSVPGGWIWDDIGNYYGAGATALNWRENQYDVYLKSGARTGDSVFVTNTSPELYGLRTISELKAGPKGSGDNAYIYQPPYSYVGYIRGTIPPGENQFKISGSIPEPALQAAHEIRSFFSPVRHNERRQIGSSSNKTSWFHTYSRSNLEIVYTHYSPSLDSIIYWFNKKSINLYGEALIKTFAYEKQGAGSTDSGVAIVKKFWKGKGIDEEELNIYDGSGLSPLNRVTTHAQVEILKYAKTKEWFPYFLKSLPEYNGITMKSGTISDVKGFCGYHKAKDGREYIFSFLVNNYSGKTSGVVQKMYKVLDELK